MAFEHFRADKNVGILVTSEKFVRACNVALESKSKQTLLNKDPGKYFRPFGIVWPNNWSIKFESIDGEMTITIAAIVTVQRSEYSIQLSMGVSKMEPVEDKGDPRLYGLRPVPPGFPPGTIVAHTRSMTGCAIPLP